jgi:diketogulonate reductase-like aldo/keto reductase
MPRLGIGTWQNTDAEQCAQSVRTALESGYRHVDTAQIYGNEDAVGDGIAAADVDRDDVFLATKVWTKSLAYDDVLQSTEESLDKLGVDHVDLLYIHWPAGAYDPEDTLAAFDELYEQGTISHIGVSNFEPHHVETAVETLDAPLFANQIEMHPFLQQSELRAHAKEHDYEIVAYSPLARGGVFDQRGTHPRQPRESRRRTERRRHRAHRRHRDDRPSRRSRLRASGLGLSGLEWRSVPSAPIKVLAGVHQTLVYVCRERRDHRRDSRRSQAVTRNLDGARLPTPARSQQHRAGDVAT